MSDTDFVHMDSRARANLSFALKRITEVQQVAIATTLGLSGATISRFVSDDLARACAVLTAAGIKLVPADATVYDDRKVQILFELTREYLNGIESAREFMVEEE